MKEPAALNVSIAYADNAPVQVEVSFSLSYLDWCTLQRQPYYRELLRYLAHRQTQGNTDSQFGQNCL